MSEVVHNVSATKLEIMGYFNGIRAEISGIVYLWIQLLGWLSPLVNGALGSEDKLKSILGEGSFGKVVKCLRLKDNKTVAVKVIKKKGDYYDRVEKEVCNTNFVHICPCMGSAIQVLCYR
uniref:Protein kinase domain-containing protein n=1 Tax=Takifugu rubripes TaxID=31033 RepID=A0A674MQ41_TAKRU